MPHKPQLNSLLLCDTAILDAESRKRSLIGIFLVIRSVNFPCTHQSFTVYATITDAQGEYAFSLRIVEVKTEREICRADLPKITINDPLHIQEICLRLLGVTFPAPGRYEVAIHANGELLDLRRLMLEQVPQPGTQQPGTPGLQLPPT